MCVHIHDHANRSEPGPHRVSLNKAASSHQNEINSLSHNFVDYTFTSSGPHGLLDASDMS